MNKKTLAATEAPLAPQHIWKPQQIDIELETYDALQKTYCLQSIDLATIIGFGRRSYKEEKQHQFFLPRDKFCVNTAEFRRSHVVPYIANACSKQGFDVRMRGWNRTNNHIDFMCSYGRRFQTQQSVTRIKISAARKLSAGIAIAAMTDKERKLPCHCQLTKYKPLSLSFKSRFKRYRRRRCVR
jgi:hypothetical protein